MLRLSFFMQLACYLFLREMTWLLHRCHLVIFLSIGLASYPGPAQLFVTCSTESWAGPGNEASIGIGASLAGPVLARTHFWRFNEMVINIVKSVCALCARLLHLDHFKRPSYTPA